MILAAVDAVWTGPEPLRVFGGVVILVGLSMLATTRFFYRLQRHRVVAAVVGGGFPAIAVGFVLGPHVVNAVDDQTVLQVRPLLMVGIGWIGTIVGMQAHRRMLAAIPGRMWRWVGLDAAASAAVIVAAGGWLLWRQLPAGHEAVPWLVIPLAALAASTIGWSPETRSLVKVESAKVESGNEEPRSGRDFPISTFQLSTFLRGGSGLASLISICLFGAAFSCVTRRDGVVQNLDFSGAMLELLFSAALALLLGVLGRQFLLMAGRDRGQTLVVFLGLVTFVSGVAAELTLSPLFTAMLAGAIIANFGGPEMREFEQFALRVEHAIAVLLFVLAGILLEPAIQWWGWGLVGVIVLGRLVFKPLIARRHLASNTLDQATKRALAAAPIRQSPLAIAIVLSIVLAESSTLNMQLLTVVVIAALCCEVLARLIGASGRSARRSADDEAAAIAAAAGGAGAAGPAGPAGEPA